MKYFKKFIDINNFYTNIMGFYLWIIPKYKISLFWGIKKILKELLFVLIIY